MRDFSWQVSNLPPEQQAIRAKCFHPTGKFVEFSKEDVEKSIVDRFEKIVRLYPDGRAVRTKEQSLTYDELNRAANRVARIILAERGQGNEPVAILLEHGAPAIIAILGVLKTGKIYVLLDPSYPEAWLNNIRESSQASVIVTDNKNASLASRLAESTVRLLDIDESHSIDDTDNPSLTISPDSLAYILYTSGSTGQPKGVTQNHRNVLYTTISYTNKIRISTDDRLTLLHSCGTGSALYHLFSSLLNGATLFPFDIKEQGVAQWAEWVRQEEISIYHSVPAVFRNFVSTLTGVEEFPTLRLIHLSAAPASKKDVELYRKYFLRNCIFAHTMGSTEALLISWYFMDKETKITGSAVPVGYTVDEKEVVLLDVDGQEVGSEQVGEIAVRSRYLSPGYWQRPDLTQAKFLADANGGKEHIYLTGDLGCMLPDGCLYHLGRKDFQVKVRGYRIEIAEIERALTALDTVKEAVVVAREDRPEDKRLIAYIVPVEKPPPTVSTLRRALAEKFPDYMIPSAFVLLDSLPLTPNGKVDRRTLPAPDQSRPELEESFVAPRTSVEEMLAEIWSEVLKVEKVGIHDNFFDLGGHSLAATRVVSLVIKRFNLELPLRSLFDSPTVAHMAAVITEHQGTRIKEKDLERILAELESMTDEEAKKLFVEGSVR